jgi:hypothetical protein
VTRARDVFSFQFTVRKQATHVRAPIAYRVISAIYVGNANLFASYLNFHHIAQFQIIHRNNLFKHSLVHLYLISS